MDEKAVRPYRPEDLGGVRELIEDERALSMRGARAHVAAGDPAAGLAVWLESGGDAGLLSFVATAPRAGSGRRLLYQLSRACAREALGRGVLTGRFVLRDARLRDAIVRDFAVEAVPRAFDPRSGEAVEWEVRVDVADAVRQLEGWLRDHA